MKSLLLYHGSSTAVRKPCIERCRPNNDYGQGFYCTESLAMAKEWACQRGRDGFANIYELPLGDFEVIDLNAPGYGILHWLEVLYENRLVRLATPTMVRGAQWLRENFFVDLQEADLVTGYRADDSYFGFARSFLRNEITLGQLRRAMTLGQLGTQYMVKSPRAFAALRFMGTEAADASQFWPLAAEREEQAQWAFQELLSEKAPAQTLDDPDTCFLSTLMTLTGGDIHDRIR